MTVVAPVAAMQREAPPADAARREMFLLKADVAMSDAVLAGLREASDAALGIDAALLEDVRATFALGRGAFARIPGGTFHRLYAAPDGRLARIAVLPGEPWAGLMELESCLAAGLRGRGLVVPASDFAACRGRGVLLVERVAGEPARAGDEDEALACRQAAAMAGFLRALHAIEGTGFGPVSLAAQRDGHPRALAPAGLFRNWDEFLRTRLDENLSDCVAIGAVTPAEAREAAHAFSQRRPLLAGDARPALLHGDPGSHNFLFAGERLAGVVDWEDALVGDPLFDLAALCTFHPPRRHAGILAAYGVRLERGTEATRRFWAAFLRIAIAKTVHRHRFGYTDAPGRAPAADRIRLALEALRA